jgi:predicted peroxiredoxin
MKQFIFLLTTLTLLQTLSFAKAFDLIVTPSHDEEPVKNEKQADKPISDKALTIMINSESIQKAGLGYTLAIKAAQEGIDTTIILGTKAIQTALIKGKQNSFIVNELTPRQMLQNAIKDGAKVVVITTHAKALGYSKEEFIEGIKLVNSDEILQMIYKEKSKLLSF